MKRPFGNSLLFGVLVPVLVIGVLFSFFLIRLLEPPLVSFLKAQADTALNHTSDSGINVCEERLDDLLDLRMEDNPEMNLASKKQAIEEIKGIHVKHSGIQMLVVGPDWEILGASFSVPAHKLVLSDYSKKGRNVIVRTLWGKPVRISCRYFPFWRWHIVSLISEKDYMAPILMAKKIVALGTFGVLLIVLFTVLLLFVWRVNRPLKQIMVAAEKVGRGNLNPVQMTRKDEIGKVADAFNAMVKNLSEDRGKINRILQELRDSEERYRILTEYSLTHIAMIREEKWIFANKIMLETLNYSEEDLFAMNFWEVIDPRDRGWVREKISALEKGDLKEDHFQCRYRTRTRKTLWLEMLTTLILFQEKHAVIIHAIDVTSRNKEQEARKELEAKLARAEKMEAVGALAGGVAHDLNNILSGLVSYPELLLMDIGEDSPMRKPLTVIQKSGQKASDIVQDMLTLARRGVDIAEVVNLTEIVSEYLASPEFKRLKSFHKNVIVETSLAEDLLNIKGSPVHLSKTVMNLVANAAEAMPRGGTILLSTENRCLEEPTGSYETVAPGDYVILTVSDTGIGITPKDIEKIFEPFYTKKVMGRSGTGLGMAVVWGTVKDHKGYVDVRSTEGKGTVFTLYFPLTRELAPEAQSSQLLEKYLGNGESILVVDDVEEQRLIASAMLTRLGYSVVTAASGEEAVGYLKNNPVDLVILDMIMDPGMDGLDTYRAILEMQPEQKAIIASGFSETERVKEARKLGAAYYVKKPYVLETIGLAVKKSLDE